jgi:hypothetical protein
VADEDKKDRRDNSFIGAAGVHYAAYKLTRKGMLALPTVRNTPGTDLIVTSRDGRHHANIQVKTSQYKRAKFWIICSAKKFEERELKASENDYFLLLRPRRDDDAKVFLDSDGINEFEGFMLTAKEANQELRAHLNYWKAQGKSPNFSLCIWVDKSAKQEEWKLPTDSKAAWRNRWLHFENIWSDELNANG